ncbi:MAG: hypothetical protein DWQ01_01265 [Planctomycetota bacterium]|nr:MAG: hypothetical protein DWQ01_01265 [Planctomycetota bacterium]
MISLLFLLAFPLPASMVPALTAFPVVSPAVQQAAVSQQQDLEAALEAYETALKDRKESARVVEAVRGFGARVENNLKRLKEIELLLDGRPDDAHSLRTEQKDLEKENQTVAREVWKSFSRRKRMEEGNQKIWNAAIDAYGRMGFHGPRFLWKAFEDRRFRKDSKFQGHCVRLIGKTLDYRQHKGLADLLKHHDPEVIAGAADAIAYFDNAPGAIRRECTKHLVKLLESYRSSAQATDEYGQHRRWARAKGPMIRALKSITGADHNTSLEWTRFWNKNKNSRDLWRD